MHATHLREHGADKLGDAVLRNVEQARELARAVEESADFELLAPQSLQIVAFRFVGGKPSDLDALNQSLVVELQERAAQRGARSWSSTGRCWGWTGCAH